jgi:hypothetical protein
VAFRVSTGSALCSVAGLWPHSGLLGEVTELPERPYASSALPLMASELTYPKTLAGALSVPQTPRRRRPLFIIVNDP